MKKLLFLVCLSIILTSAPAFCQAAPDVKKPDAASIANQLIKARQNIIQRQARRRAPLEEAVPAPGRGLTLKNGTRVTADPDGTLTFVLSEGGTAYQVPSLKGARKTGERSGQAIYTTRDGRKLYLKPGPGKHMPGLVSIPGGAERWVIFPNSPGRGDMAFLSPGNKRLVEPDALNLLKGHGLLIEMLD
ncbi:MAG: hypothetical protein IPM23_20965 [Candidatus Melainabacteria bacterium]|nr:hypothetical protein [Candidatus Melainabacteria bacterium]